MLGYLSLRAPKYYACVWGEYNVWIYTERVQQVLGGGIYIQVHTNTFHGALTSVYYYVPLTQSWPLLLWSSKPGENKYRMAGYFQVFKFSQFSRIDLKPWKSALKIWESGLFPLSTLYCRSFEPIHEIKSMKWVICEYFSVESN